MDDAASSSGMESDVQIGDFRIQERLGAGGMGIVYRARQLSLDREVALKVLGGALSRAEDISRFEREAQAAARLNHPNIASVYFIGQDDKTCYIAMELIDGDSLNQVIELLADTDAKGAGLDLIVAESRARKAAARPLRFDLPTADFSSADLSRINDPANPYRSPRAVTTCSAPQHVKRCCEIVRDAARALAHAHEKGVVHRDIKPANVLIDVAGQPHLIDFGVARFFDDVSVTFTGQLVGTPMYMSPEQIAGRADVDLRTDIYSLGLVLYELLTLRPPVQAPTREQLLRQIITKPLPPVSWLNPAVGRDLESIVHKATQKDPDERYQSVADFAGDIERFLAGKPVTAGAYQYRFDMREIVAARPTGVVATSFLFFLTSALCALFGLLLSSMMLFTVDFESEMLVVVVPQVLVAAGCVIIGVNLLAGRGWAWWVAIVMALLVIVLSGMSVSSFVFVLSDSNFEPPNLPDGVDRAQMRASMMGSLMPMIGVFACGILGGLYVLIVLFRRSTRAWFRMARDLRREHRRLKGELTGG